MPAGRRVPDSLYLGLRIVLVLITAAGMAIDAYIHADLAGPYGANPTGAIGQDTLFLIEAAVASLAAVLVFTDRRWAHVFAFLIAASALGAILLYRYVDVGQLGPLPRMYEPIWFPKKTHSAIAEAAAMLSSAAAVLLPGVSSRSSMPRVAGHRRAAERP